MTVDGAPFVPWDALRDELAREWEQGQHLTLVGKTRSGKTTAALRLVEDIRERARRGNVVMIRTKRQDKTLTSLKRAGWHVTRTWPPSSHRHTRVVLYPRIAGLADVSEQRDTIRAAFDDIWRSGGWTIVLDELPWLDGMLGLGTELRSLWMQGASAGITLVASTQRPRRVPLEAYTQVDRLIAFRIVDDQDLKRLAEMGAVDKRALFREVRELPRHTFVMVDGIEGSMVTSKVPRYEP